MDQAYKVSISCLEITVVARCTRPDMAFVVHKTTGQTYQSLITDYKAAKRISQYINGIRGFELNLTPGKSAGKTFI